MKCPECEHGTLTHTMKEWVEQTGERCSDDWWECWECGMKFDTFELVALFQPVFKAAEEIEDDGVPF